MKKLIIQFIKIRCNSKRLCHISNKFRGGSPLQVQLFGLLISPVKTLSDVGLNFRARENSGPGENIKKKKNCTIFLGLSSGITIFRSKTQNKIKQYKIRSDDEKSGPGGNPPLSLSLARNVLTTLKLDETD